MLKQTSTFTYRNIVRNNTCLTYFSLNDNFVRLGNDFWQIDLSNGICGKEVFSKSPRMIKPMLNLRDLYLDENLTKITQEPFLYFPRFIELTVRLYIWSSIEARQRATMQSYLNSTLKRKSSRFWTSVSNIFKRQWLLKHSNFSPIIIGMLNSTSGLI